MEGNRQRQCGDVFSSGTVSGTDTDSVLRITKEDSHESLLSYLPIIA